MKRLASNILTILFFSLMCFGCCKREADPVKEPNRTVIIYMEANNNLFSDARSNISAILSAATEEEIGKDNNLIIFLNGTSAYQPSLYRVTPGAGEKDWLAADTVFLKSYPKGNTLTSSFMRQVLTDAKDLAPADEYGLVLWSHGQGWIPKESLTKTKSSTGNILRRVSSGKLTKWFGLDYSYNAIDIKDLRSALECTDWEFIIMDACFGGSIESLYELRGCCKYWAGSPTEIMQEGFPYGQIISNLFDPSPLGGMIGACAAYMASYAQEPDYPSASICAVDMSTLDKLAESAGNMVKLFLPGKLQKPNFDSIQYLDNGYPPVFYDLDAYFADAVGMNELDKFSKPRQDSINAAYQAFQEQIAETIQYTDHTERIYSCFDYSCEWIEITHSVCGLTSYIPRTDSSRERYSVYNKAWYETSWVKDIGITAP